MLNTLSLDKYLDHFPSSCNAAVHCWTACNGSREVIAHNVVYFNCKCTHSSLALWTTFRQSSEFSFGWFQKIRAVYESDPTKFKTLKNILEVEKEMYGAAWPKAGATLALMWLKRWNVDSASVVHLWVYLLLPRLACQMLIPGQRMKSLFMFPA